MSTPIDLRSEPALSGHEQLSGVRESRFQALLDGSLLRDSPLLSDNARRLYQELIGVDWTKRFKLADRIEIGGARENEDEHDTLYEAFPEMVDLIVDLFGMISRRDEAIAGLGAKVQELEDHYRDAAPEARFYDLD